MSENATILHRSKSGASVLLLVCSLVLISAIALVVLTWDPMIAGIHILVLAVAGAVCLGGIAVAIAIRTDVQPQLVIDEEGITDYRCRDGPRRIPWHAIQSMDCEITTVNGAVKKARVNMYVVTADQEIQEAKVNVASLDSGPKKVFGLLKKAWIQFNYRRRIGIDFSEPGDLA